MGARFGGIRLGNRQAKPPSGSGGTSLGTSPACYKTSASVQMSRRFVTNEEDRPTHRTGPQPMGATCVRARRPWYLTRFSSRKTLLQAVLVFGGLGQCAREARQRDGRF